MIELRRSALLVNLVLLAAVSVIVIVAFEVSLRVLMPELLSRSDERPSRSGAADDAYYIWQPGSQWTLHPSPRYVRGIEGPSKFSVNREGIRGRDLRERQYRILAVGGSTTGCLYLDDAEAWPALMEAALQHTADGRKVWVGNAGKSGMNLRDHVVLLQSLLGHQLTVDTVVLLAGVNDLSVRLRDGPKQKPRPPLNQPDEWERIVRRNFTIAPGWDQRDRGDWASAISRRASNFALYQLIRSARTGLRHRLLERGLIQGDEGEVYKVWRKSRQDARVILNDLPDLSRALEDYRINLVRITEMAVARSVRLVLLTQPAIWRDDLEPAEQQLLWLGGVGDFQREQVESYYSVRAMWEGLEAFNQVTRAVCKERRLECVDLAALMPGDANAFYDDVHFTEAGSRAVARAVIERLRAQPPFGKP